MHAKPVEASAALQPATSNKIRKIKSSAKHPCTTDKKNKATDRTSLRKTNSHTLFGGDTKPYKADSCQAVIVIETFSRGPVLVKGITLDKEKRYCPGDLNYVGGESPKKKLTSVLLCDTTSAYLYAFKRADIKPHFVLPMEQATEYICKIVKSKKISKLSR